MSVTIRKVRMGDANKLFNMLCELDKETDFMMYEPGERTSSQFDSFKNKVEETISNGDLLLVAEDGSEIVGFLSANRGKFNRVSHTAYVVIGLRSSHQNKGIGKRLFLKLDEWVKDNSIIRVELTVEVNNDRAKHLYEINGFEVEGVRRKSMLVSGELVDEYYMAKIYKF